MLINPKSTMKHLNILCLTGFLVSFAALAQQTIVRGSVNNLTSNQPLHGVHVEFEESLLSTDTDTEGVFEFSSNIPIGEHILKLTKPGYLLARYPIVVYEGQTLDIQDMVMSVDPSNDDLFTITLTDDELNDDNSGVDNISGLLGSSKDIFQRTAAFEFSTSFFNVRGLNSENGILLMNGIDMNKLSNGRPQWSNWGGLNDVLRNQELTSGLAASSYNFGGVLGSTNINLRASEYQSGRRITYSSSNRSYTNRLLATYASGLVKGGWSYVFSLGRRWGNEGYQDGTFYDANSFFGAVEKRINKNHSLNFTAFYTPNRRGKSSPNSQEVYDLKNIKYNEYWGYQDGRKRNSRVKRISEPVVMLNHYWNISDRSKLNTNIAYQFGELGNSRLDYAGGANPSPAYYQDLPSYFLANSGGPDLAGAYEAYQNFTSEGQLDWNQMYDANITNNTNGDPAAYVWYEDRNDDTQLTLNTIFKSERSDHLVLNAAVHYKRLQSHNFAEILDMLGSTTGYLNIDSFDQIQLNLKNPNQIVGQGDIFKYNYNLEAKILGGFAQAQFTYNKVDFFIAASITKTDYQREGFYQHEIYVDNSYGKGPKVNFTGIGTKGGLTYKFSGKHLFTANAGYLSKAPTLRNTFSNSRENHAIIGAVSKIDITDEKTTSLDVNYRYRSSTLKARLTGYYSLIKDANEISFFYADGLSGVFGESAFVQEILQGVDKKQLGLEFGIEAQVTPTIALKGALSMGQFTYNNNPNLVLTSSSFPNGLNYEEANLKNYKIAGGPQRAASIGFEYRDPKYWWFGTTANFFSNAYLDISSLTRTKNFYLETDGFPFPDYDPTLARALLTQEKFDSYMVINAVGGKSWRIGKKYLGLFVSLNNLLDIEYKTGGFEQGRNANYRSLKTDVNQPIRRFGPKYWYGRGATYFMNLSLRF